MNNILETKNPMMLNKELAEVLGTDKGAIVLQQIQYWINKNKEKNKNLHRGCWWTFNTIADWTKHFGMWSYSTIKRILSKLRKLGVLITDNFNSYKYDRTLWYTINYDRLSELVEEHNKKNSVEVACSNISSKCTNALDQNEPMHLVNMNSPIPEITSEITKETYTNRSSSKEKEEDSNPVIENKNTLENNNELNSLVQLCQNLNFKLRKATMKSLLDIFSVNDIKRAIETIVVTKAFISNEIGNIEAYLKATLNDFKATKTVTINNTITSNNNNSNSKPLAFTNYSQREYDYNSLEKQLLGWD